MYCTRTVNNDPREDSTVVTAQPQSLYPLPKSTQDIRQNDYEQEYVSKRQFTAIKETGPSYNYILL